MMIGWGLILILLVAGLIWAFRSGVWGRGGTAPRDPAEDALREQYARGDIDDETYRRRLDELRRR